MLECSRQTAHSPLGPGCQHQHDARHLVDGGRDELVGQPVGRAYRPGQRCECRPVPPEHRAVFAELVALGHEKPYVAEGASGSRGSTGDSGSVAVAGRPRVRQAGDVRSILVTGASTGIGRACALHLAKLRASRIRRSPQ